MSRTHRSVRIIPIAAVLALSSAAAQAAGDGGLEIFPDNRLLMQLALFVVLIAPMNKLLFQPVLRVLEERRERIQGARERAETVRHDAESVLERYEGKVREAREQIEAERKERVEQARAQRAETSAEARSSAEKRVASARAEVASTLESSRAQLRREAEELAREAASRILGRSL